MKRLALSGDAGDALELDRMTTAGAERASAPAT